MSLFKSEEVFSQMVELWNAAHAKKSPPGLDRPKS